MLKAVQRICDAHGIKCFALGGTLLGAVRHGGFIPWDDDIDLAIYRDDYDRFLAFAQDELPSHLEAHDYKSAIITDHLNYIIKIYDMRTKIVMTSTNTPQYQPISIDVFPFDGMPAKGPAHELRKFRILYHKMKSQFSMYEVSAHQHRASRPLHEKLLMRFRELTKFGANWDTYQMMEEADKVLRECDPKSSYYAVNAFGAYKFKEMFPNSWIGEGVLLPFEDTEVLCPVAWDSVLTQMYGDYMTPIAEEQRGQQHRTTVIAAERSEDSV